MPIAPTLILGLGGTGSKIVENVYEKVRESETGQSERIAFVVFDTDINDLGHIRREKPEIHTVQTSTRNTVGEYLGINTNARDNWFPVNEMLNRKTLTEGAAQVRAISRLAFDTTLKSGYLAPLHNAIEKLFRVDKDQEEQSLRVIITSSLAGGTGSGLILSVAMYLANYLKTKYPKAKAITRGFFIQPDVFYKVIPGAEEQQNLRVNAYAAVRELDAFLMKGDNTLPQEYAGLEYEFPRIGADGVEVVRAMPYDFCFLFDANNKNSGSLDSFASYLDHAATCIYTQSIGPMSKKSNSREDNVLREVIKHDGRNRYAGAGASRLVYPWQHVRDVTGYRWADIALSSQWLQFDHAFKEQQAATLKQREAGFNARDLDRAQEFISAVDAAARNKEHFALAIRNQCLVFDEENLSTGEDRWSQYVGALQEFVENDPLDESSESSIRSIKSLINDLDTDPDPYALVFRDLERLKQKVEISAEERAGVLGYTLFKSDSVAVTTQGDVHRLETYLRDRITGEFVHPVAARYFLYNTQKMLKIMKTQLEGDLADMRDIFDGFEEKHFDDPTTEERETADMFGMRKLTLRERVTRKPSQEKEDMVRGFHQYLEKVKEYSGGLIFSTVLSDAMEYVQGLSTAFEHLFVSLENNLKRLRTKISQEKTKYDGLTGSTTRYVLADSQCLEALFATMPYTGGIAKLDSELSESIYNRVRDYHMLKDEKNEGFFKDLYNHTILGYFSDQVMKIYGSEIKMDIIEALEREYRTVAQNYEAANAEHYVKTEIEKAKHLAAPFIEQPLGEERHPIVACAYNPAIEGDGDPKRKSLISEYLGNYGGEKDTEISPHEILFYNAIYGIRARDLSKYAAAREAVTEHRPAGEYFTAYYNLVSGIKPSVGETKVITPHIDRRWHSISAMPDLDEANQAVQLRRIHDALLLGLTHKRIEWIESPTNDNSLYRYKPRRGLHEDFVVSNGTPCDEFYEVVDALTISPVIVEEIIADTSHRVQEERQTLHDFDQTILGKALSEGVRLDQLGREYQEFANAKLSVLDVAAYFALSTPVEERFGEQIYLLAGNLLEHVREQVQVITDADEVIAVTRQVLERQLKIFAQNVARYYEVAGRSFVSTQLRTVLSPLEELAEELQMYELVDNVRKLDEHLRKGIQGS